jgi:hypothetical protein
MSDHPLRLAAGSHEAGSGKGCAMNVISWESGDTTITDLPACTDPMLAWVVQNINDHMCSHRDGDLLCPACSIKVLALAHRTVGTGSASPARKLVWVRLAAEAAREVLHFLDRDALTHAVAAIGAAEAWLAQSTHGQQVAAKNAAGSAYALHPVGSAYLALSAARSVAWAAFGYGTSASSDAADVVLLSIDASVGLDPEKRLAAAHRWIDRYMELTGHTEQQPDETRTAAAVRAMQQVTA